MADIARILARMQGQIAELQRRLNNTMREGVVVKVDPGNQRVKVDIGDDDNPLITPWIRWPERAGARKTWNPPSVGELMTVHSPGGEISENSIAFHGGFAGQNVAPSGNGDAAVFTLGQVTVTVIAGGATIQVEGVSAKITGNGLAITGGKVTHNGTDIGDTHKHIGVQAGPTQTGKPV